MTESRQIPRDRGVYLAGLVILGVAALRALIFYQGQPQLIAAILLLAVYGLLYAAGPWLSSRFGNFRWLYFPLQTVVVVSVTNLRPFLDVTTILYIPLFLQALRAFSRRIAFAWLIIFATLLTATLVLGLGWAAGMAFDMMILGGCAFLVSYELLYTQMQLDQAQSQVLVSELQQAHHRLQQHAAQAEELAAARERNRLARDLHESVSQVVFGITLTSRAARLLLEREPARVPEQLDHLERLTRSALDQLRSLIAQLRPPHKA